MTTAPTSWQIVPSAATVRGEQHAATDRPDGVSIITTLRQFDELEHEWRDVLDNTDTTERMHDPDVIRQMLIQGAPAVAPSFVLVRRHGRIECIAPFYLQRLTVPLRLSVLTVTSFRARALRLFGDCMLLRRGVDASDALEAVFGALNRIRLDFDVIWIYMLRESDPLRTFLKTPVIGSSFRPIVTSPHPEKVHHLMLDRTFEDYLVKVRSQPGFPGKTIRRFWRDMKDRCAVERVNAPGQIRTFVDDLDRVYNASWQARTYGQRRRNADADVASLETSAALGYLRSYVLKQDGIPIAFILGHQYRGHYAYEETAYDSTYSSSSPGSVLTYAAIEDLFRADSPRKLDFGFGDGAYKRTFGTGATDVCSVYIVQGMRWRAIFAVQQLLNVAYEIGHATVTRFGIDAIVRRRLKRTS